MNSSLASLLNNVPGTGACLGVDVGGRVETTAVGHRQAFDDRGPLASPLPMTADTWHDLGSVTKVVGTTAALLALVDEGTVELDSRLSDLLRHRAGLWEWWPTYVSARDADAALDVVAGLPLRYPPGSGRHYSDLGFMTLGRVVAVAAGRPLADAVASLVSEPLGLGLRYAAPPAAAAVAAGAPGDVVERHMLDTGTPYPVGIPSSQFGGWRARVRAGEVDDGNAYHAFGGVAGHAGLFGRARDLLAFGRRVLESLRGDGPWRAATIRRFLEVGPDAGQALGFRTWPVDGCATPAYGHTGFPGVAFAVLPSHDAVVVLLTNRLHTHAPPPPAPFEPHWLRVLDAVHRSIRSGPGAARRCGSRQR